MADLNIEWVVLTKAPIPGLVKTRLIPDLGRQGACDIYIQLLDRLEKVLSQLIATQGGTVALWIAGDQQHEVFDSWSLIATCYPQPVQGDLGERMGLAVKSALSRGRIPILIGVDVPDLNEAYLADCVRQLHNHDLVISPAEDGGYGVLGMKAFYAELFEDKSWGTDSVFSSTHLNIEDLGLSASVLPMVWDVDEPADVKRWLTSVAI